jgi:hypothetical protein
MTRGDAPMTTWTSDELDRIGAAEELKIASIRRDATLRNSVTIWVVRVGNDLDVGSTYGRSSAWFRESQMRREGRIQAGGIEKKHVVFLDADHLATEEIDAAYRTKYRRQGATYVNMMLSPEARSAAIKLAPR